MPLPAGERLDEKRHPHTSWPLTPPSRRNAPPLGRGRGRPARLAKDGTRWCAYCDTTLDPDGKTRRCGECARYRDNRRHHPDTELAYPVLFSTLDSLIDAARRAEAAAAPVHAKFLLRHDLTRDELLALFQSIADLTRLAEAINQETAERHR